MGKELIPLDTPKPSKLRTAERYCVIWHILTGCKPSEAFKCFVKPELAVSAVTLQRVSDEFFADKETQTFMKEYRALLERKLEGKTKTSKKTAEQRKKDKEDALQSLMDYVVNEAMNIDSSEDKEEIIKFADKLGLLDSEEIIAEAPRRYLPESCSACRYRHFCEEALASDAIDDSCQYCRARKHAEAHGFKYDPTTLLDIPKKE